MVKTTVYLDEETVAALKGNTAVRRKELLRQAADVR
jgi:hypothetical protein